jgi:hypothetical protein
MIQFFIENQEVILPDDFSFTQIDENPLITNNGEFTLDITVSLRNGKNAKAAKFINRVNKVDIDTSYNAFMIDDGKYKYGTVIIQSHTNTTMTFQFVAGNSELNYIAKTDKKIWEYDFGTATELTLSAAIESLNEIEYSDTHPFICVPVKIGDEVVNDYLIANYDNNFNIITQFYDVDAHYPLGNDIYYTDLKSALEAIPTNIRTLDFVMEYHTDEKTIERWKYNHYTLDAFTNKEFWIKCSRKILIQPYLMYYIEKLPELLGYTLKFNVLRSDKRAMCEYLLNTVDSLNYSDMLADITLTEFIDSIENSFNVIFLVDKRDKSISIHNFNSNLENKSVVSPKVINGYERDFSPSNNSVKLNFTRIKYNLPDNNYYRYHSISDDILNKCEIKEFANMADLEAFVQTLDAYWSDKYLLLRDLEKSRDWIAIRPFGLYPNTASGTFYTRWALNYWQLIHVNKFYPVGESGTDLELKIIPAVCTEAVKHAKFSANANDFGELKYQIAVSSNEYYKIDSLGLIEKIESTETEKPRLSYLEVALYAGKTRMYRPNATLAQYTSKYKADYFFSYNDLLPDFLKSEYHNIDEDIWLTNFLQPLLTTTLALKGANGLWADYKQQSIIDTSKEYVFEIPDSPYITADKIFEYENLYYLPISLERKKSKQKGLVKGTFYRML